MQSWLVFLLLSASLVGTASAASERPTAPCDAVATHVKSAAADPKALGRPPGQDYDDYDSLLAPAIAMPPPEPADGELWAKVITLLGGNQDTVGELQHVDGQVWRFVQVAGTAHCQTEHFFSVRRDGGLSTIDTPPTFGNCWSSARSIGRVGGKPALIEQEILEHPLLGVDVEITPWTNGELTTCQVAIRFNDAFSVTERFCKDASVCLAAESLVPRLAEALARDEDGKMLAAIALPPPQQAQDLSVQLARAKERFESDGPGYTELPTFGARPRTKYPTYAGSPQVILLSLPGQTLIARVGIGGIGWRELGDYLISLYRGDGDDLDPVASFVVARRNTGLRSVTTSVPQPHPGVN